MSYNGEIEREQQRRSREWDRAQEKQKKREYEDKYPEDMTGAKVFLGIILAALAALGIGAYIMDGKRQADKERISTSEPYRIPPYSSADREPVQKMKPRSEDQIKYDEMMARKRRECKGFSEPIFKNEVCCVYGKKDRQRKLYCKKIRKLIDLEFKGKRKLKK